MSGEEKFSELLASMDTSIRRTNRTIAFMKGFTESIERWRLQRYIVDKLIKKP